MMKRDYAKKKHKAHYSRQHSYWRLWFGTITLFVLFTLGLAYLGKHYQLGPMLKIAPKPLVKESPPKQVLVPKPRKQPHFDFYTTLQK